MQDWKVVWKDTHRLVDSRSFKESFYLGQRAESRVMESVSFVLRWYEWAKIGGCPKDVRRCVDGISFKESF